MMAKGMPKLRVVGGTAAATRPSRAVTPRWQGHDVVFFHKSQIYLGTRLINCGRLSHGSIWAVVAIKTYHQTPGGRWVARPVDSVTKLSDELVLQNSDGSDTRQLSFAGLSYSAIWRLVQS